MCLQDLPYSFYKRLQLDHHEKDSTPNAELESNLFKANARVVGGTSVPRNGTWIRFAFRITDADPITLSTSGMRTVGVLPHE